MEKIKCGLFSGPFQDKSNNIVTLVILKPGLTDTHFNDLITPNLSYQEYDLTCAVFQKMHITLHIPVHTIYNTYIKYILLPPLKSVCMIRNWQSRKFI